jgi:hypothetical protein
MARARGLQIQMTGRAACLNRSGLATALLGIGDANARVPGPPPPAAEFYEIRSTEDFSPPRHYAPREMLGEIMLSLGQDGSLWAEHAMQPRLRAKCIGRRPG